MSNIEKENLVKQIKLAKIFKRIIVFCMIASFLISVSACKEASVVEEQVVEEEKGEVTIPSETKETTPETAQETTPGEKEIVEIGPVEYKGIMINPIEGLRFEDGSFYTIDNRYNLPPNTEAGKFIIDALEFNGKMENSIALKPEVIEILQLQQFQETGKIFIPVPVDLDKVKGVKINLVESKLTKDEQLSTALAIDVPEGTIFYSLSTMKFEGSPDRGLAIPQSIEAEGGVYSLSYNYDPKGLSYEGFDKVDAANIYIFCQGAELLNPSFNKDLSVKKVIHVSTRVGEPLFKISSPPKEEFSQLIEGAYSAGIFLDIAKAENLKIVKRLMSGDNLFLKINKVSISIYSANEK